LGKLAAIAGKREYLASIMRKASESVARLEGCLLYVVFEDLNEKDSLWITEI
jgi:quinol monooxygenase YgiN